jgi:hypothetical protein
MASICSAVASTLGWRCISFILAEMGIVEVGNWTGRGWDGMEWERDELSE